MAIAAAQSQVQIKEIEIQGLGRERTSWKGRLTPSGSATIQPRHDTEYRPAQERNAARRRLRR